MEPQEIDMPYKLARRTIVIVKDLPVVQCVQCAEQVIEDPIMKRVESLLENVDPSLELELVGFSEIEFGEDQLYEKVEKALRTFFKKDGELLHIKVNERSITHKIAEYLQYQFPGMNVDCEYNRRPDGDKVKRFLASKKDRPIVPDIIVHKRVNNENNCLVIEIKIKKTEIKSEAFKKAFDYDLDKLKDYTSSYGYKVGLFLEIDMRSKGISEVFVYKSGHEEKTDMKWKRLTELMDPALSSEHLSEGSS